MRYVLLSAIIVVSFTGCGASRKFWEVQLTLGVEEKLNNGDGKVTAGLTLKRPLNTGAAQLNVAKK